MTTTTSTNNKKKVNRSDDRKVKIVNKLKNKNTNTNVDNNNNTTLPMPAVKPGMFTNDQLASLLLLSIGLSRIMQLRSAFAVQTTATTMNGSDNEPSSSSSITRNDDDVEVAVYEASPICIEYLGSTEVCVDSIINTLIQYKYEIAIESCLIVIAIFIHIWNTPSLLSKCNALFIISPIMTGLFSLYLSNNPQYHVIPNGAFWSQGMICIVLTVIVANAGYVSFTQNFGKQATDNIKSIPNLCLAFLIVTTFHDANKLYWDQTELHGDDSVIQLFPSYMGPYQYWYAAQPIVYMIVVDKITNGLMYLFSWYYLPDPRQRNFLLAVCMIKLREYFYQLPSYQFINVSSMKTTALMAAIFCGIACFGPTSITFRKNSTATATSAASMNTVNNDGSK